MNRATPEGSLQPVSLAIYMNGVAQEILRLAGGDPWS